MTSRVQRLSLAERTAVAISSDRPMRSTELSIVTDSELLPRQLQGLDQLSRASTVSIGLMSATDRLLRELQRLTPSTP